MDGKKAQQRGNPRIVVIGAGMSGILTAIKLLEAGIENIRVYEKAEKVGGTWRENTYPGLSCDVPSHVYSYSFELNPRWSRLFSPGAEIQAYFEDIAEKYELDPYISFNTEIIETVFHNGQWHIKSQDGHIDTADFIICATGVLHHPAYPDIEGVDEFAGPCFHTACWDHSVDLADKRVGIIGTGSTAIQIVPAIVDVVTEISLFQRTAQWIFPLANPYYTEEEIEGFEKNTQIIQHIHNSMSEALHNTFARAVIGDEVQMNAIDTACRANLTENVKDPELRQKLTPDYIAACKRLIMSNDFYPAIQKPNANLVTEGIERIEADGVRTKDGTLHALDILVLATGFHGHQFMRPMNVIGKNGVNLGEEWADVAQAYRSVAVPGFPNFFTLVGPNSPIGNFSLIEISELQLGYIMQLIAGFRAGQFSTIAPRKDVTDKFNADILEAMKGTVWVSGCKSWYLDKNGNPAMWPWPFERFTEDMSKPKLDEFELTA